MRVAASGQMCQQLSRCEPNLEHSGSGSDMGFK